MNVLELLYEQLCLLKDTSDEIEFAVDKKSLTLTTAIHFDTVHITVSKGDAFAGWKTKNTSKNDYALTFTITLVDEDNIQIDVYSYGLVASSSLCLKTQNGLDIWCFSNYNNDYSSYVSADYPYIQFTDSLNQQNPFTKFIAGHIFAIKDCLNKETLDYPDTTTYASEPEYHNTAPEGDLVLTIKANTLNILKKKAFLKLPDELVSLNESMIGKKIVRKDSDPTVFYPLHVEDFVTEKEIAFSIPKEEELYE